MSVNIVLAVGAGGAIGSILRYWLSISVHAVLGRQFPWGTLSVNVIGSFMMGLLFVWLLARGHYGPEMRAFLLIGLLGGFTTFSAFSVETMNLIEQGDMSRAAFNVVFSVLLCVAGCLGGMTLGRQL